MSIDETVVDASPPNSQHRGVLGDGEIVAGRWRIGQLIARGGMGEVYAAEDLELGVTVALKTMRSELSRDPRTIDRFKREIELSRRVTHPGVCRVFDLGTHDGQLFLTMELLAGETLSARLQTRGRLTIDELRPIVRDCCDAMSAAHEAGIVHRDFKSSNVMLVRRAGVERAVVTDFGIAHVSGEAAVANAYATPTTSFAGTPGYMAPEQVEGGRLDATADVYALGVVMFEMLSGRLPFNEATPLETALANTLGEAPSLRDFVPDADATWVRAISRCLARDPRARFQSMLDVAAALSSVKRSRRRWAAALAICALAITAVAWIAARSPSVVDQPRYGGTLRFVVGLPLGTFAPYAVDDTRARIAQLSVMEPLFRNDDQDIEAAVIEHAAVSTDRVLTLKLRQGVTFHDHPCFLDGRGRAATSADVVFSIREAWSRNPNSRLPLRTNGTLATAITTDLATPDDHTVTIALSTATPLFADVLSGVFLLPRELAGCEDLSRWRQPVGTGPFRFTAPPTGERIQLVRAPRYWRASEGNVLPYLDAIDVLPLNDIPVALSQTARAEVDLVRPNRPDWASIVDMPDTAHPTLSARYRSLGVGIASRSNRRLVKLFGLYFSQKDGPLRLPGVRRAIARGIDRAAIVASSDQPRVSTGRFLDARMLGYDPALAGFALDLRAARRSLDEVVRTSRRPIGPIVIGAFQAGPVAELLVQQLAKIGLKVRVVTLAPGTARENLDGASVDALLMTGSWYTVNDGEFEILKYVAVEPKLLPELRENLARATERADRARLYRRIEQEFFSAVPMIPIAWGDNRAYLFVVADRVRGFHDPITGHSSFDFATTWLDGGQGRN